eukprot:CAMPEP_0170850282 /NCGR_PEP_ID=MMETSP0734-20130129/10518_1 /TAXON_ID=186038 /ORGANISM="Fragilariopsis kerguelensis, Strain L26-C5" /LENGTH=156 /DNA_ID=CAMNT_0011220127 /DNA_START=297 /DNA_END=767 /DNA_ORIENTATION=-
MISVISDNDDDTSMEQFSIIDNSSNKIRRSRKGATSEVDDYCYSRNYKHKHKHNGSFLQYYSSALEIINEDEEELEIADSDDDDDDTFSSSSLVLPMIITTTDFCLSQRRMKKSHSVSSSLSSLFLLEEEKKQDHNIAHHVPAHTGTGLHYTAKSA